jgi:hypothetical protein
MCAMSTVPGVDSGPDQSEDCGTFAPTADGCRVSEFEIGTSWCHMRDPGFAPRSDGASGTGQPPPWRPCPPVVVLVKRLDSTMGARDARRRCHLAQPRRVLPQGPAC